MSERFFVINLRGLTPKEYGKRLSKTFYALHGAIFKGGQGQVGLSFPGWRSSDMASQVSMGSFIAVVSKNESLLRKVADIYNREISAFDPELKAGSFYAVPEDAERVTFRRNRRRQKYLKIANDPAQSNERINWANEQLENMPLCPKVFVASKGTKQIFTFEILMEKVDNDFNDGAFSTYGLANTDRPRSVPLLTLSE